MCNDDGSIARLDGNGGLGPVSLAALHALIDKHICGVRVVKRGTGWERKYYSYAFAPRPNRGPPTMANPHPDVGSEREPDDKVLEEIYRHALAWRLPKVEA